MFDCIEGLLRPLTFHLMIVMWNGFCEWPYLLGPVAPSFILALVLGILARTLLSSWWMDEKFFCWSRELICWTTSSELLITNAVVEAISSAETLGSHLRFERLRNLFGFLFEEIPGDVFYGGLLKYFFGGDMVRSEHFFPLTTFQSSPWVICCWPSICWWSLVIGGNCTLYSIKSNYGSSTCLFLGTQTFFGPLTSAFNGWYLSPWLKVLHDLQWLGFQAYSIFWLIVLSLYFMRNLEGNSASTFTSTQIRAKA